MIGKKASAALTGALYSLFFGVLFSAFIFGSWPQLPILVKLLISGVLAFAFYFLGVWIFVRNEQNKEIPTPSHELRRRKKAFYDWLDSRGRR